RVDESAAANTTDFDARLAGGWTEGTAALRDLRGAVAALASEPVSPAPGVKTALLDALPAAGMRFRFAADGEFRATRYPGIWVRTLHIDEARKQFTCLMRLDPGAVYPSHGHDGPEECLVLEGEILVGNVRMRPGDYQRAEPGSHHIEQRTEVGALVYL